LLSDTYAACEVTLHCSHTPSPSLQAGLPEPQPPPLRPTLPSFFQLVTEVQHVMYIASEQWTRGRESEGRGGKTPGHPPAAPPAHPPVSVENAAEFSAELKNADR
jgi:hypothetical protein